MLNEDKIRVMTKLASYEKHEGRKYLPVSKYYRSDYIGLALIKNFFMFTIAYVLLLSLICIYFSDELLERVNQLNLVVIAIGLLIIYLLLLILYSILVYVLYSVRYDEAKKNVRGYYTELGRIAGMYMEDEAKENPGGRRKK